MISSLHNEISHNSFILFIIVLSILSFHHIKGFKILSFEKRYNNYVNRKFNLFAISEGNKKSHDQLIYVQKHPKEINVNILDKYDKVKSKLKESSASLPEKKVQSKLKTSFPSTSSKDSQVSIKKEIVKNPFVKKDKDSSETPILLNSIDIKPTSDISSAPSPSSMDNGFIGISLLIVTIIATLISNLGNNSSSKSDVSNDFCKSFQKIKELFNITNKSLLQFGIFICFIITFITSYFSSDSSFISFANIDDDSFLAPFFFLLLSSAALYTEKNYNDDLEPLDLKPMEEMSGESDLNNENVNIMQVINSESLPLVQSQDIDCNASNILILAHEEVEGASLNEKLSDINDVTIQSSDFSTSMMNEQSEDLDHDETISLPEESYYTIENQEDSIEISDVLENSDTIIPSPPIFENQKSTSVDVVTITKSIAIDSQQNLVKSNVSNNLKKPITYEVKKLNPLINTEQRVKDVLKTANILKSETLQTRISIITPAKTFNTLVGDEKKISPFSKGLHGIVLKLSMFMKQIKGFVKDKVAQVNKRQIFKNLINFVLAYTFISNVSYVSSILIAFTIHCNQVGVSPFIEGHSALYLKIYNSLFDKNYIIRPLRFLLSLYLTPYFESILTKIQRRHSFSRLHANAAVVIVLHIAACLVYLISGLAFVSKATKVPLFWVTS